MSEVFKGPPSAQIEERDPTSLVHIPLPGEHLPPKMKVLKRQDFSYAAGNGICTLSLVKDANGVYAVLCIMHLLNSTRRFRRQSLKEADARYTLLHEEMVRAGMRLTKF